MKILIVYYSGSGNTKKVSEMVKDKLQELGHEVLLKNALTVKTTHVEDNDLLIIGTPIHGYILFGQKHAKELNKFLSTELPEDLSKKPVIIFATFAFFPSKGLKRIQNKIKSNNGNILGSIAQRRNKKELLSTEIVEMVKENS
ncbi:MAG: flavodoxin family protein [Candidatus Hodarchaeales archaeon]